VRTPIAATGRRPSDGYRHEAFFYAGPQEFLHGALSFIREGLAAEDRVLVAVDAAKIDLLRAELDGDADRVHFADMAEVGANPARIIPAWRDFVSNRSAPGRGLRGIGEPIWPGRSPAELVECHRHESLLNLAFADTPAFWLLCPYDTDGLDPALIEEAQRTHPFVMDGGVRRESPGYEGLETAAAPFSTPLPDPPAQVSEFGFDLGTLGALRRFVSRQASGAGLPPARTGELLVAVTEVAGNSVRHAGGRGALRMWQEGDALICEVRDKGRIEDPLVGRERPVPGQESNFGLWLANQFCELVQVRSFAAGSVVRLHVRGARPPAK
jgi:anti-sigma regulatory factor (Ser/Thr protein kinase)